MNTPASHPEPPTAASWEYAEDHVPPTAEISEARDEATIAGLVPVSQGVLATLRVLTRAIDAHAVVEIGTDDTAAFEAAFRQAAGRLTDETALLAELDRFFSTLAAGDGGAGN